MVQPIPPPQPRDLLPPLLACLATSFASSRPPPALLPLLSPILRQRVQLLSSTSSSWLPLLCWDANRAVRLPKIVENVRLEPHPVSGEIELQDVDNVQFRRLDPETLHARFEVAEFGLLAIYLWCVTDAAGGGNAWRLAELRSVDDKEDGTEWYESIAEANEVSISRPTTNATSNAFFNRPAQEPTPPAENDDDDDAYWASYDRTPGRTPAKRSPAPMSNSSIQLPTASELEYFARYAAEVQPAADPHDPDEEMPEPGTSTLSGNVLTSSSDPLPTNPSESTNAVDEDDSEQGPEPQLNGIEMSHPRPRRSSSASSSRSSVEHLEYVASSSARAESSDQAEMAIKQHIATEIKSLYRLARNAGIQREEFVRTVQNQLECLSMMDLDPDMAF